MVRHADQGISRADAKRISVTLGARETIRSCRHRLTV